MSDMPREWWIQKDDNGFDSYYEDIEGPSTGTSEFGGVARVLVIEKSAYETVKKERDEFREIVLADNTKIVDLEQIQIPYLKEQIEKLTKERDAQALIIKNLRLYLGEEKWQHLLGTNLNLKKP